MFVTHRYAMTIYPGLQWPPRKHKALRNVRGDFYICSVSSPELLERSIGLPAMRPQPAASSTDWCFLELEIARHFHTNEAGRGMPKLIAPRHAFSAILAAHMGWWIFRRTDTMSGNSARLDLTCLSAGYHALHTGNFPSITPLPII